MTREQIIEIQAKTDSGKPDLTSHFVHARFVDNIGMTADVLWMRREPTKHNPPRIKKEVAGTCTCPIQSRGPIWADTQHNCPMWQEQPK